MTDREGITIAMSMENAPQAVAMRLQKEYAEKYNWLVKEFTNWAFTFMTSFLYYITLIMTRLTKIQKKPLSQARRGMNFAASGGKTNIVSTNQEK